MSNPAREALWTREEVLAATGGRATGAPWAATGVSIDSRTLQPGDLFVAVKGENHDGHRFVDAAFERGAAAALVAETGTAESAKPMVRVSDMQAAIERLGQFGRARSDARITAITGSVGKTSTKEAMRHVLEADAPVSASAASFNNHIGVPISLARLPRRARYGVFEIGTNHPGEIAPLSRQARPHVAVITAIAPVHIEFFASVAAIAEEKAQIFVGMEGGTAIVNRDSEHFDLVAGVARRHGVERLIGFGVHAAAQMRQVSCVTDPEGSEVVVAWRGDTIAYRVGAPGAHWAANSLAVLAAAAELGLDPANAAASLAGVSAVAGRGARRSLRLAQGHVELVDESYNASPTSVRAMLSVLAGLTPSPGGRRVLVLGDMRELGASSESMHVGLMPDVVAAGIDVAFTCGPAMGHLHQALPAAIRGAHLPDSQALAPVLVRALRPGDIVAVKGSLGSRMKLVVEALLAEDRKMAEAA
jgi:UDP-N-acetylmuramoyl-tripeptide--D-alanyl-D-alanine ligase